MEQFCVPLRMGHFVILRGVFGNSKSSQFLLLNFKKCHFHFKTLLVLPIEEVEKLTCTSLKYILLLFGATALR